MTERDTPTARLERDGQTGMVDMDPPMYRYAVWFYRAVDHNPMVRYHQEIIATRFFSNVEDGTISFYNRNTLVGLFSISEAAVWMIGEITPPVQMEPPLEPVVGFTEPVNWDEFGTPDEEFEE